MAKKRGHGEGSIYKRPDGRWTGQVTLSYDSTTGKQKRITFYGKSKKEVLDKITEAKHQKKNGELVEPSKLTLGEWLDEWLNNYKKSRLRQTTWESYETMVRKHLKPSLGHIPLRKLQTDQLQRLFKEKLENGRIDGHGGLSDRTVRYIHTIVSMALKQAVKNGYIAKNAAESTDPPKPSRKEAKSLTNEEIQCLLKTVQGDRLFVAFQLELGTGLRRGELLGLRWQDISFAEGLIHVKQSLVRTRAGGLIIQEPKTAGS